MSKIEARIEELGITLPEASAPVGNYVGAKVVGNMVYLSGNGPLGNADSAFKGKVGSDFSLKEGYAAARSTMINLLGTLKGAIGDLDRVETIVKLLGFVASAPGFGEQPYVLNGASELLIDIFGDMGKHARAALGINELPFGTPVEIEMIVELKEGGEHVHTA